jgi:hypothetical protein
MPFYKNEITTIPPKIRFRCHEKTLEFHFRIVHHPDSLNIFRKLSHKTFLSQRRDCLFAKGEISTIPPKFLFTATRRRSYSISLSTNSFHQKRFHKRALKYKSIFTEKLRPFNSHSIKIIKSASVQVETCGI